MVRSFSIALCCCAVGAGAFVGRDLIAANSHPVDLRQRSSQVCGRFAFYSYLRCTGSDISYEQVCNVLPISDRGSSLLQIRDAARQLGIHFEIRKTSPQNQTVIQQGPLIAHMRMRPAKPEEPFEPGMEGHYVVILPPELWQRPEEPDAIDGTHGFVDPYSYSKLAKLWSGYYLIESEPWWANRWVDVGLFAVLVPAVLAFRRVGLLRRPLAA